MSQLYTGELRQVQEQYLDTANILYDEVLDAEYIGPRTAPTGQTETFFNRLPEADPEQLKWAIITYWEGSDWHEKLFDADEAIYWLQIYGLLSAEQRVTSPENFMRLYADSERIKAAGLASSRLLSSTKGGVNG